jgi:hypothetical protein
MAKRDLLPLQHLPASSVPVFRSTSAGRREYITGVST